MRLKIGRIGILEELWPDKKFWINYKGKAEFKALIDFLKDEYGEQFCKELFANGKFHPWVVILLNGKNVFAIDQELKIPLQEGDEIIFTLKISGG